MSPPDFILSLPGVLCKEKKAAKKDKKLFLNNRNDSS